MDILLLGSEEARSETGRRLVETELLIGKELDVIGYTVEDFAARMRSGNSFVRRVLTEPQERINGGPEILVNAEAA